MPARARWHFVWPELRGRGLEALYTFAGQRWKFPVKECATDRSLVQGAALTNYVTALTPSAGLSLEVNFRVLFNYIGRNIELS